MRTSPQSESTTWWTYRLVSRQLRVLWGNPGFNQHAGRWARFNPHCRDLCLTGCSGTSSGLCVFLWYFYFHISVLMCVFVHSKAFTQMHYIWTAAGKFKSRSRSGFYTAIVFRGKVSQIAWCLFPNVFPTERQTKAEPSADLKWNPVFASRPQKLNICKYTFFFFFFYMKYCKTFSQLLRECKMTFQQIFSGSPFCLSFPFLCFKVPSSLTPLLSLSFPVVSYGFQTFPLSSLSVLYSLMSTLILPCWPQQRQGPRSHSRLSLFIISFCHNLFSLLIFCFSSSYPFFPFKACVPF